MSRLCPVSRQEAVCGGEEKELWEAFSENLNRTFLPERMESKNGMVYYMPKELPKMRGLRFLRSGLFVGEMKKKEV